MIDNQIQDPNYTVAVSHINSLLWSCNSLNLDVERIKEAASIHDEELKNPEARLSMLQFSNLWKTIIEQSNSPHIGLKLGQNMRLGHWGLIEYIALNANTFYEAMELIVLYWRLVTEDKKIIGLQKKSESITLHFQGINHVPSVVYHADMVYLYRILKQILGPDITPIEFWFSHPMSEGLDTEDYTKILNAPVRFNKETNAVVLPKEQVERPTGRDSSLMPFILEQADKRLKALDTEISILQRVTSLIESGTYRLEHAAAQLHIGERTLQRRLTDEGHTFNSILNDVKKKKAKSYLLDNSLSIKEIAFIMGFQDERSFYGSTKRWFGLSPTEFRNTHFL